MLVLPIKKKWFDMIKSGIKKEEYREIKPYWFTRFKNNLGCIYDEDLIIHIASGRVIFQNGYKKNAPRIMCIVDVITGRGKPEWGADPYKLYYVLKILSVEEI